MEQVEEMCNHIVLINKGKNVLYGDVQTIKKQYKKNLYEVETDGVLPDGAQVPFPVVKHEKNTYTFQLDREETSSDLLRFFLQQPARVVRFQEILPSFNEIFIQRVAETETTA
jgi:ABC-2 type transport system ATP-binding protein